MITQTKELQAEMTPASALEILKEGNKRFVSRKMENRDLMEQVAQTGAIQTQTTRLGAIVIPHTVVTFVTFSWRPEGIVVAEQSFEHLFVVGVFVEKYCSHLGNGASHNSRSG